MQFGYKSVLSLLDSFDLNNFPSSNWLPDLAGILHRPASPTAPSGGQSGVVSQAVLYSSDNFSGSSARAGGVGHGGTTAVTSTASSSSFVINISWDASVANAPSAFVSAVTCRRAVPWRASSPIR